MLQNNKKDNTNGMEEDFDAIKRVLDGDTKAFELLQNKYTRIVSALIRKMVRDEDDVQDLTQEAFIKTYNALDSFQFGYSFSAWLYRIASNTCIDFLRKKRFRTISINQPIAGSDEENFFEIKDSSYLPDINVLADERTKAIRNAINQLPENYRNIVELRHVEELDYKEISKRLDLPLGTVKAHLFRARKMMLASLKKKEHLFND